MSPQNAFPLVNRLVTFMCGVVLVAMPLWGAWAALVREQPAGLGEYLIAGLMLAAFCPVGLLLMYWSIWMKAKDEKHLAEDVEMLGFLQPVEVPEDALTHRFASGLSSAAVIIDTAGRQIHFVNCYTPSRWLAQASEWQSCRFDELLAVHRQSTEEFDLFVSRERPTSSAEYLTLITPGGKAVIPGSREDSYRELCETLLEIQPTEQVPRVMDHPLMMYVVIGGVLVGFFTAGSLARGLSDDQFIVAGVAGAVAGAAGVVTGAWAFDRFRSR